jgi:hypothetical protein
MNEGRRGGGKNMGAGDEMKYKFRAMTPAVTKLAVVTAAATPTTFRIHLNINIDFKFNLVILVIFNNNNKAI